MALTWPGVLGWRMGRQMLDPLAAASVVEVVARLGAVPAWPDPAAELAIGTRRRAARYGDVARALDAGQLVKAYAFRGGTHYLTPQDAGDYLALRASSRMWELPSWVSHYGLTPADWPRFREYVRAALSDGNDTLLKPLTWQGDMGLGPVRDVETTFLRLDTVPGWNGVPDFDEAGPRVVAAYLRTFGPAAPERVHDWLGKGLGAKRRAITRWIEGSERRPARWRGRRHLDRSPAPPRLHMARGPQASAQSAPAQSAPGRRGRPTCRLHGPAARPPLTATLVVVRGGVKRGLCALRRNVSLFRGCHRWP